MMKNSRNALTAVGLGAVLLLSTGCGTTTPAPAAPIASETSTVEPVVEPTIEPSSIDLEAGGVKPGDVINGIPTKSELAYDQNGPYIQSTISDDDPAMQYNTAIVDTTALEAYSAEDIARAQQFIVRHIAEEGVDSVLNGTNANHDIVRQWWADNKHKYDPVYSGNMLTNLSTNDQVVMPLYRYSGAKSKLASGENVTHVNSRTITPVEIKAGVLEGQMRLGFTIKSVTVYNIVTESGNQTVNSTSAEWIYTLTKNDTTGEWMISGFQNTFSSDVS